MAARTAWHEAAELIREWGRYHWVGLYAVGTTEIAAVAWTGEVAPAFPRFPRTQGLNGAAVAAKDLVVSQDVSNDPRYLTAFASTDPKRSRRSLTTMGKWSGRSTSRAIAAAHFRPTTSGSCARARRRCGACGRNRRRPRAT